MELSNVFIYSADFNFIDKKIGEGPIGSIFIANNNKDKIDYSLKIINTNGKFDGNNQAQLVRESLILQSLNHPSIAKFKGINFQSFSDPNKLEPSIITEYYSKGSLKNFTNWNSTRKCITLLGISNAMRYLHQKNIISCDLKPENILFDDNFYPHISDFGLLRCFPDLFSQYLKLAIKGQINTFLYIAPELFQDQSHYDLSIDVYSFSILAYEILTGKNRFLNLKI